MEPAKSRRPVRDQLRRIADDLPTSATWDDVMYQVYVRQKLAKAEAAAEDGRVVDADEVRRRLLRR